MKKLMFAAVAAFCATVVANADGITSANVVGYYNNSLRDGVQLLTGAFVDVVSTSGSEKQYLSNIKIGGYENHAAFQELGTDGQFYFYFLNDAGGTPSDQYYSWYHACENGTWSDDGKGWYDGDGNLVGTDIADVQLNPGDAVYLVAPQTDSGETFTFGDSGQVLTSDQSYKLIDGVNVVGNMMAETKKLSGITISGYENHAAFQELGTDGQFYFYFLNDAGGTPSDQYYSWYHACENGTWSDDGKGWYDGDGNLVGTDIEDVDLKPGAGIYLVAPQPDKESGEPIETFTIDFQAPNL